MSALVGGLDIFSCCLVAEYVSVNLALIVNVHFGLLTTANIKASALLLVSNSDHLMSKNNMCHFKNLVLSVQILDHSIFILIGFRYHHCKGITFPLNNN